MDWFDLLNIGGSGDDPLDLQNLPETGSANTSRSSLYSDDAYGPGMTGSQTSRYDTILNLTGSKDLANMAASGDFASFLKNAGGAAKNFAISPVGIAALGALLGGINRPKPSGGGTTMAYPGAGQLTQKMIQGPYGPIAEYSGRTYTPFAPPTFAATDSGTKPAATARPTSAKPAAFIAPTAGMMDVFTGMLPSYGGGIDAEASLRRQFMEDPQFNYYTGNDENWARFVAAAKKRVEDEPARVAKLQADYLADLPRLQALSFEADYGPAGGYEATRAANAAKNEGLDKYYENVEKYLKQFNPVVKADPSQLYDQMQKLYGYSPQKKLATPAPSPGAASSATSFPEKRIWSQEVLEHAREQNPSVYAQMYASMTPEMQAAENADEAGRRAVQEGIDRANDPAWQISQYGRIIRPQPSLAKGGEARAYAGGKPLTMEDGAFVFTKRATDKLGPRGIAALGGKKIVAPGNGTDDRGITGIIGKNGVTPARVSNGESYFPPGHDTKKLYALMHSLERKA